MSFIPGEGSETLTIASQAGSGIAITAVSDVNYLSANLIAGTNITLVPSVSNTSITISSSGAGGGIASVSSGAGSGIEATTVGSGVNLTSALVAGTGIQLVASGINKNLTINNTQSITTATGCGISATTVGGSTALVANLTAGNGITITPSVANTSKMISNAGLLGLTSTNAGANCSITGTATTPIINCVSTSTNPVRNTTRQTLNYTTPDPPSGGYVLNNFAPSTPQTVFTITLPSAYTGCNNFTFYIGNLSTTASTTNGTALTFLVYPSNTLNGDWNFLEGTMNYTRCPANPSTTSNTFENQIWNWTPTGGLTDNKIYINVASYTSTFPTTTTTMTALGLIYDLVGITATLT